MQKLVKPSMPWLQYAVQLAHINYRQIDLETDSPQRNVNILKGRYNTISPPRDFITHL